MVSAASLCARRREAHLGGALAVPNDAVEVPGDVGVQAAGQVPGLADPVVVLAPESTWGRLGCAPRSPSRDHGSLRRGAPKLSQGVAGGVPEGM